MRMPDVLLPASVAVVVLSLLASVGWGVADFSGGLASRRAPVLGVLGGSQLASVAVGTPILLLNPEPPMRPEDLAIAIGGGVLGAAGLALLYRGLSAGRMGVVAPVAAVITATLPVVFGFVTEGIPSGLAVLGIALAVASVVLVSRAPAAETAAPRPSGIWYAVGAGLCFGLFTTIAAGLPDDLIISPVIVIRVVSVLVIAAWVLARRAPWRVERRLWPALVIIGVIDMTATGLYLSSIAVGPLAIAAILASLYPVVTAILAFVVLRERLTRIHAVGVVAAAVAVVLIAAANAA